MFLWLNRLNGFQGRKSRAFQVTRRSLLLMTHTLELTIPLVMCHYCFMQQGTSAPETALSILARHITPSNGTRCPCRNRKGMINPSRHGRHCLPFPLTDRSSVSSYSWRSSIYFDWSMRRKIPTLLDDSNQVVDYLDLFDLLDHLKEPHRIIGEATFESFRLDKRRDFIDRCDAEGHILLTVPNRETARWRERAGFSAAKTPGRAGDLIDLQAIRMAAQHTHLKKPRILPEDDPFITKRIIANRKLQKMRANTRPVIGPRGGVSWTDEKEDYALEKIASLPPFCQLGPVKRAALGQDQNYSRVITAAVGVAAEVAEDVKEFDRLAGLYAHGYPSQIRSDLMFHGWAGPTRGKLNAQKKRDDLTLSEYRNSLRWLYRELRHQTPAELAALRTRNIRHL